MSSTTEPTESSFLAAIVERPDDDAPRLVYADWLQQRGDPRGEFIALQLARVRGEDVGGRDIELLERHRAQWAAELGLESRQMVFERGLASSIGLVPLERLLQLEVFDRAPIVRLAFDGLSDAEIERLVASERLSRIRDLILDNNHVGARGAVALADSPSCGKLVRLSLRNNRVGPNGAAAIARSPHLASLRQLDLSHNGIEPSGARAVLESPGLASLVRLGLAASGWRESMSARPALEALNLSDNGIGDDDLKRLARAPLLDSLSTLFLASNPFGDDGVAAFAARERLPAILDLSYTRVGDAGVTALVNAPSAVSLRKLRLAKLRRDEGSIGDAGAKAIASSPHVAELNELLLVGNHAISRAAKRRIEARFGRDFIDRVHD